MPETLCQRGKQDRLISNETVYLEGFLEHQLPFETKQEWCQRVGIVVMVVISIG